MDAANAVPVIGTPLAYGVGFAMLLLVVLTGSWASSLVTVAHEGGHIVLGALTFRGPKGFRLEDSGSAATSFEKGHWSVGDILTTFAGYPAPCLLGLGGAALVRSGHTVSVLWISEVLLVASFLQARKELANVVTGLAVLGVGFAIFAAGVTAQVVVGVALVWWMLIGGAYYSSIRFSRADTSDAHVMARRTLVPRIVWHALWAVIGIVCLWKGGQQLLAG